MSTYEISKSSLLSLKAEILRKQHELSKAKVNNDVKKKALKKNPLDIKNKGIEARETNDLSDVEIDLLKKSKSVLEYKAELYNKLSSEKPSEEGKKRNKHYLVMFDKKNSCEDLPPNESDKDDAYPESDDDLYNSDEENNKDPGERWVDYVDSFGRTRRCLQKDLDYLKSKDQELGQEKEKINEVIETNQEINSDNINALPNESDITPNETSEILSHDTRREILREQWEKEEEELRNKSDIHYQDLLFGEARSHGVGYYSFSKNDEERTKQQEALKKLREETLTKQKKAQDLKNSREKLLAARLKAARNRKRARMGLPPEEDEEVPTNISTEETTEEDKEKQEKINERESLLTEARKNHIRPWDIGKEGVKEHQIMTQEEWVEEKRTERPNEFAPPTNYRKDFRAEVKQNYKEDNQDNNKVLKFTTKGVSRNKHKYSEKSINFKVIEQSPNIQPTAIEDLDTCSSFDDKLLKDYIRVMDYSDEINREKGVEIAPPPTYDYYGPSQSKIKKNNGKQEQIHESIEAGLKFLRKQIEVKEKSTKRSDDMFLF